MLAKLPTKVCRSHIVGPATFVALLVIGLVVTDDTVQAARRARAALAVAEHEELTVTVSKVMISTYISPVSAAITARHIIQSNSQHWNATDGGFAASFRGLRPLLEALASSFAHVNLTFVGLSALTDDERHDYELQLTNKCANALNVTKVSLINAADVNIRSSALPAVRRPVYPSIIDLETAGTATAAARCAIGLDFTPSNPHMRIFLEAVDTARLSWQPPLPFLVDGPGARTPEGRNIGILLPLHARTEAEAGPAGVAHTLAIASRPDLVSSLPVACDRNVSQPGSLPCGQARRALGAIAVPMYASTPLRTLVDTVPHVKNTHISVFYVPRALEHLVQIESGDLLATAQPRPDPAYLDDKYLDLSSWTIRRGTLAALMRASDPGNILLCVHYVAGRVSPLGSWHSTDPFVAKEETIAADLDSSALQAARAFALGRNLYVLVLRDRSGAFSSDFEESQTLTWILGGLLTALCAVALPLVVHMFIKQQERQHAMQMAVVQSEKDGVVQAVAFAAHEIRNPMHGVLASLETGLDDLQSLIALLKEAVESDTAEEDGSSKQFSDTARSLLRLLGREACDTALVALEDVGVAKTSAESCHRLINDMVDYSKLQRGIMSIEIAPMDVRMCLRALLQAQRSFLGAGVRTFMAVHADVPDRLQTDQVRILQVITNGVTNAGKFTQKGAIYVTCMLLDTSDIPALVLPSNPSNKWICFVVCDTGKGLAGIDVDALFEPGNTNSPATPSSFFGLDRLTAALQCASRSLAGLMGGRKAAGAQASSDTLPPQAIAAGTGAMSEQPKAATTRQSVFASSVAKMRGSGLGLPVARLMARCLGGDVDLYTEPVNRLHIPLTRFIFALPFSAMNGSTKSPEPCPMFGRSGQLPQEARKAFRQKIIARLGNKIHQVEELTGGDPTSNLGPLPGCLIASGVTAERVSRGPAGSRDGDDGCRGSAGTPETDLGEGLCPCGPPPGPDTAADEAVKGGVHADSIAVTVVPVDRSISTTTHHTARAGPGDAARDDGVSEASGMSEASSDMNPTSGWMTPPAGERHATVPRTTSPVLGSAGKRVRIEGAV